MDKITTKLPDEIIASLDNAANTLHRPRAEIVREAIERYLEDFDDLHVALKRLKDPPDPVPDWDDVKRDLLGLAG